MVPCDLGSSFIGKDLIIIRTRDIVWKKRKKFLR